MDYKQVKTGLDGYAVPEVDRYVNYLRGLASEKNPDNSPKNWWFEKITEADAIGMFKKVAIDGLFLDGDTITLQYKKKLIVSYDYHAYKNRVLWSYPETKFDIQLVHEGDDFSFRKESGLVVYSHKLNNPFDTKVKIMGAYCVIKNQRGEFLEILNMEDIQKMKSAAMIKTVWEAWFSEMVLKSVIKRACKRHFRDITQNIDTLDNENYDLGKVGFDQTIAAKIEECKTVDDLTVLFKAERNNVSDEPKFIDLCATRKQEIVDQLKPIIHEEHETAINMLKSGTKPDQLRHIWKIADETMENLISKAI